MKTTVIRIQDKEGRGPWKPGFSDRWVEWRDDCTRLLPGFLEFPTALSDVRDGEHIGSGCMTIEQLRRWFTENEYRTLLAHGYQAVQIEVDRIIAQSEIQCIFARRDPLNLKVHAFNLYEANS